MNTIREEIEKLEDRQLDYVVERSRSTKDVDGYKNAGISKATFYSWPNELRDHLNGLAQRMKREAALKAQMILEDGVEDAARLLLDQVSNGGDARKKVSPGVQQRAAIEILDRVAGKPSQNQKVQLSGEGGGPVVLQWPEDTDD